MTCKSWIVALPLLVGAGSLAAQNAQPSFCERMASELNMKPTTSKKFFDGRPTWQINKLGGIGTALFGGSTFISISAGSNDVRGPEDYQRLSEVCQSESKSIFCRVVAPDFLVISVEDQKAQFDTLPGEKAEVEIYRASVICRDGLPEA